MSPKLSQQQIQDFQRDGAICLRNVFSPDWIKKVEKGIQTNLENPSSFGEKLAASPEEGIYFNDYCNWKSIPEFHDYIYNSPAAEIAGKLTCSSYAAFYHEHVLVKEPGSSKPTPWHVDQSYYPINGNKVCSVWMPVDHVGEESTIQFLAGSHLWPKSFIPRKFATSLNYERVKEEEEKAGVEWVNVPSDEEIEANNRILKWEVSPGDCVVFHMKTVHGAPGNKSTTIPRRILSTRWLGDDAVIASRPWDVSPPLFAKLNVGDKAASEDFPIIWQS